MCDTNIQQQLRALSPRFAKNQDQETAYIVFFDKKDYYMAEYERARKLFPIKSDRDALRYYYNIYKTNVQQVSDIDDILQSVHNGYLGRLYKSNVHRQLSVDNSFIEVFKLMKQNPSSFTASPKDDVEKVKVPVSDDSIVKKESTTTNNFPNDEKKIKWLHLMNFIKNCSVCLGLFTRLSYTNLRPTINSTPLNNILII